MFWSALACASARTVSKKRDGSGMSAHPIVLVSLLTLVPGIAAAQPATEPTEIARMPWGHPDLQGYWTTQTFTPLERPEHLAGQDFFTEEESAALEQQLTAEGVDPSPTGRARSVITSTTTTRSGSGRQCPKDCRADARR